MSANDDFGATGKLLTQATQVQPTHTQRIGIEILLNAELADRQFNVRVLFRAPAADCEQSGVPLSACAWPGEAYAVGNSRQSDDVGNTVCGRKFIGVAIIACWGCGTCRRRHVDLRS